MSDNKNVFKTTTDADGGLFITLIGVRSFGTIMVKGAIFEIGIFSPSQTGRSRYSGGPLGGYVTQETAIEAVKGQLLESLRCCGPILSNDYYTHDINVLMRCAQEELQAALNDVTLARFMYTEGRMDRISGFQNEAGTHMWRAGKYMNVARKCEELYSTGSFLDITEHPVHFCRAMPLYLEDPEPIVWDAGAVWTPLD